MNPKGRVFVGICIGVLVAAGLPLLCRLVFGQKWPLSPVVLVAGPLLAAIPLGYLLRGLARRPTVLLTMAVWFLSATALWPFAAAGETISRWVAGRLLATVTFGVVTLHSPHGWQLGLPWVAILIVLPTLIWQGFFEGLLGRPAASGGPTMPE